MTTIGPYRIEAEIGRGATGRVLRARAPDGGTVAVKLLERTSGEALARFDRERRLLATLGDDAGFVPLLDAGRAGASAYVVMPFLEGGTLRARLERGPLPVEETVALGRALAAALGRAHAQGIVHRDVKPENVLFTRDGAPRLADLGIAKHLEGDGSASLSRTGVLRGTAGYAPREQLADAKSVGPSADVFALGAVLYECLTGAPAFAGPTALEVITRVESGAFAPIRSARPDAPPALSAAIEKALAREPDARFPDGAAFARALEAEPRPRRRALAAGLGAVAIAAVTAALATTAAPPPPPPPAAPVPPKPAPPPAPAPSAPATWRWSGKRPRIGQATAFQVGASVTALAFTRDGDRLVVGTEAGVVVAESGRPLDGEAPLLAPISCLAAAPGGLALAAGLDGKLRLLEVGPDRVRVLDESPRVHEQARTVAVAPGGTFAVSAGTTARPGRSSVHFWRIAAGRLEQVGRARELDGPSLEAAAFEDDERSYVMGEDGLLHAFVRDRPASSVRVSEGGRRPQLALLAPGRAVLTNGREPPVLLDLAPPRERRLLARASEGSSDSRALAVTPDRALVAIGSKRDDGLASIELFDAVTGARLASVSPPNAAHALAASSRGAIAAGGWAGGTGWVATYPIEEE